MNRKTFIKQLFGCSIAGMFSFSCNAKTNAGNDETLKEKGRYVYRRYVAEKYVNNSIGKYINANGQQVFYLYPVGYVQTPDAKTKEIIEIPANYRKLCNRKITCSDRYTIYDRELLIRQLVDFFKTRKTGTFLDRI